jgi:hypothetical protein
MAQCNAASETQRLSTTATASPLLCNTTSLATSQSYLQFGICCCSRLQTIVTWLNGEFAKIIMDDEAFDAEV